jgi:polyisoprenoid-binding protein YceI
MRLGPENGSLTVKTGRTGAAAKAGHNLLLEVTAWEATLDDSSLVLTVEPASLRVLEGTGGMQALGDDDKASIEQTIGAEVLKGQAIEFRSTTVRSDGSRAEVEGELTLGGTTRPLAFALELADGEVAGSVVVKQSRWGITPYSTLFGTLKVVDEVEVAVAATLPQSV